MAENVDRGPGSLDIDVDTPSHFLRAGLPFVVRDAHGNVVADGTGPGTLTLPGGLYSLTAVGSDGRPIVEMAEVRPSERTPVVLTEGATAPRARDVPPGLAPPAPPPALYQCQVRRETAPGWEIVPDRALTAVPTATLTVVGRTWEICLPLNPAASYPLNACRLVPGGEPWRPQVSFAPERRVARFVAGLNGPGNLMTAAGMLEEASELLMGKYSDPPAAALAALTLHRIGQLDRRPSWVENLAVAFPWLPDGGILLAALLAGDDDPAQRRRGLDVLLAAAASRPLYTDGLSLAMELLRRWPDDASAGERRERLAGLAAFSAYADWDSLALCVEIPQGAA